MTPKQLNTCGLRQLRESDAQSLAINANNPGIARNLRDQFPSPYKLEDAQAFIKFTQSGQPDIHLAIDVNGGDAVGVIGVRFRDDVHRLTGEVGYWIGENFWGRGIVTEALDALTDHVFQSTALIRLDAFVYAGNPASARVLEKAGYRREGVLKSYVIKNDQVLDASLYARIKGEF